MGVKYWSVKFIHVGSGHYVKNFGPIKTYDSDSGLRNYLHEILIQQSLTKEPEHVALS